MRRLFYTLLLAAGLISILSGTSPAVLAAGATTEIHIVKYEVDGSTILSETTVSYQWMEKNLPVYGDGVTHYYHQGPIFEGDMWDPSETHNLKDKGAVMGTSVRDLCDQVGGMLPGHEVRLVAVDGWSTRFAYENICEPLERQGEIVLCWFNGGDTGEGYGIGYPGIEGYHTAIQIVFISNSTNPEGKHVFGNDDMRVCLPEEEYQHFYQGFPSTNGLSGKWITRLEVLPHGADPPPLDDRDADTVENGSGFLKPVMWVILGCGIVGVVFIARGIHRLRRKSN
jgi:hypothetical protein